MCENSMRGFGRKHRPTKLVRKVVYAQDIIASEREASVCNLELYQIQDRTRELKA